MDADQSWWSDHHRAVRGLESPGERTVGTGQFSTGADCSPAGPPANNRNQHNKHHPSHYCSFTTTTCQAASNSNYISLEHGRGRGIFIDCNYFAHHKTLILSVLQLGLLRIRAGRERQSDRGILLMVQTRLTWLGKVSLANFGDKVMSPRRQIIPRYIISVMIFHFLYYCIIDDL